MRDMTVTGSTLVTAIDNLKNLAPTTSSLVDTVLSQGTRLTAAEGAATALTGRVTTLEDRVGQVNSTNLQATVASMLIVEAGLETRLSSAENVNGAGTLLTLTIQALRDLTPGSALTNTVLSQGERLTAAENLNGDPTTLTDTLIAVRDLTTGTPLFAAVDGLRTLVAGTALTDAVIGMRDMSVTSSTIVTTIHNLKQWSLSNDTLLASRVTSTESVLAAMAPFNLTLFNTLNSRVNLLEIGQQPSTVLSFVASAHIPVVGAPRNTYWTPTEAAWPSLTVTESGSYLLTGSFRMSGFQTPASPPKDSFWAVRLMRRSAAGVDTPLSNSMGASDWNNGAWMEFDHQTAATWAGTLNAGDKIRPWFYVGGSGTTTVSLSTDYAGGCSLHVVKLVGSGLTPTAFTATPSCPSYACITLSMYVANPTTYTSANSFYPNWFVADISQNLGAAGSTAVPAGCPSPFAPFVASKGGVTIVRSGEYRATAALTYPLCNDNAYMYCHGWFELVPNPAGGKGLSRLISYMSTVTTSYMPNIAVSFQLSETDVAGAGAFLGLRLYAGTISLGDTNRRFFQVERVADYTPANRQVEPTPVPTDYANQLATLSAANASLTARMSSAEAGLVLASSSIGLKQFGPTGSGTAGISGSFTVTLGTLTVPVAGTLNLHYQWQGQTCSANNIFTGLVSCQLYDNDNAGALVTPIAQSSLATNERFGSMSDFHREGYTRWNAPIDGRSYTIKCKHENLNNAGTQFWGAVYGHATLTHPL
jgi:hypothetical protein